MRKGDEGGEEEGRGRRKEMEGEVRREAGGEERRWRGGEEGGKEEWRGEEERHTKYPLSLFTYLTTHHLGLLRGDLADSRPLAGPAYQNMPSLSCPGTCIREREPIHEWNH